MPLLMPVTAFFHRTLCSLRAMRHTLRPYPGTPAALGNFAFFSNKEKPRPDGLSTKPERFGFAMSGGKGYFP
ncbi:MAG: hypothetical protein RDU30_07675 [Desulfovibrionaceae bacterium]|nr:hypothetical protein [Desulfovibrionaceae bacterium]